MTVKNVLLLLLCVISITLNAQISAYSISSPDNRIVATIISDAGQMTYKIDYNGGEVLK